MRLIKVKKVKKIVWHNIAHFIVELDKDEYMSLVQKEKEDKK